MKKLPRQLLAVALTAASLATCAPITYAQTSAAERKADKAREIARQNSDRARQDADRARQQQTQEDDAAKRKSDQAVAAITKFRKTPPSKRTPDMEANNAIAETTLAAMALGNASEKKYYQIDVSLLNDVQPITSDPAPPAPTPREQEEMARRQADQVRRDTDAASKKIDDLLDPIARFQAYEEATFPLLTRDSERERYYRFQCNDAAERLRALPTTGENDYERNLALGAIQFLNIEDKDGWCTAQSKATIKARREAEKQRSKAATQKANRPQYQPQ